MIALKLTCKNDSSGNPRRCFVVIDEFGQILDCIDEGFKGSSALSSLYPMIRGVCLAVETTVPEYKKLLKQFGKR